MYPRRNGDYVKKPIIEMTGKEMLEEFLDHLALTDSCNDNIGNHTKKIMDSVINVIPVYLPYASSLFNQRAVGDRPKVVPKNSKNLAFVSQFCEHPFDMVFTEQYSVRAAQIAVYTFLGLPENKLTSLNHYEKNLEILTRASITMFR